MVDRESGCCLGEETHRDAFPTLLLALPTDLRLRCIPLAVKQIPRVGILLRCGPSACQRRTLVKAPRTAMNALSCSSGFCWVADITFVSLLSDTVFTLHNSLLMADMQWWWTRQNWWYLFATPQAAGWNQGACDHAGSDDVRTSGAADRGCRQPRSLLCLPWQWHVPSGCWPVKR